jgi:Putative glucoamylase/Protein of unknown function (DUF3131)
MRTQRITRASIAGLLAAATSLVSFAVATPSASGSTGSNPAARSTAASISSGTGELSAKQRQVLLGIAKDTWKFFGDDVDPTTNLPLDNIGPGTTRGQYTSAANIGVYLWSVISAHDLGLITEAKADSLVNATLTEVSKLKRTDGFLYQWYDTNTGDVIRNPGDIDCKTETTPMQDNCFFLSAVDNGWYASGLAATRQALPRTKGLVDSLMKPMNFGIFYDDRAQTNCNTNVNITGNQPTGQQYGGFYVDQGPAGYHNGALYSDPRISMYMGMGMHQMPGDVWWRTWRVLPPKRCSTDPDFSWQGQPAPVGSWVTYTDPQSHKKFPVWEGHYTYPGTNLTYVPTFSGGMFEGLMANEIVPETTWGADKGFGLNDKRDAQVQVKYATEQLKYPVWGISPSSTADDTGNYSGFGVAGLKFPAGEKLSQDFTDPTETTVTPHASFLALDVLPQEAYANIEKLRSLYPGLYSSDGGFFDAVNPTTGSIGHRRLVLDQSMIMASLDNALDHRALQRHFAADPTSWAAKTYLRAETLSIH